MQLHFTRFLCLSLVLAACTAPSTPGANPAFSTPITNRSEVHQHAPGESHEHPHVDEGTATQVMRVVLVPSELVVGPNRFAVGLMDSNGRLIDDAVVHFHYYDLSDSGAPRLESEADAERLQAPDGFTTVYAHERDFAHAGPWGVEVQARWLDGTAVVKRIQFEVAAASAALTPGEKAPRIETPTAADVKGDLRRLTTAPQPNPAFYQLSIVEALANGKPTLILFSTPAFCTSRLCGPVYDVVSAVQPRYAQAVNFVHIEVYSGLPDPSANDWALAPAMTAFGLTTEPWTFFIDVDGVIVHRVEGLVTPDEIKQHLELLLNDGTP
jgi:hypothetical protein